MDEGAKQQQEEEEEEGQITRCSSGTRTLVSLWCCIQKPSSRQSKIYGPASPSTIYILQPQGGSPL